MNLTRLAACASISTLLLSSPLLAGVGEILSLERQIHTRAEAVNLPSGNRVDVEENDRAPDPGPWVSAVVSNARAQENESVSFVSTAYQRSSAILVEGGGTFQAQGWATTDTLRIEPLVPGESFARSVFDITFTLEFPRELVLFGSLRSEIQTFNPPEGGALLLLTGENGEILRRQVGTVTETLDLSHTEFLEPGTYRLLVRAHRGGGRRFVERLGVGRSSFDVHADFRARPLVLEVSPLVRGEEATFSVRDADPDIEVKVFATMNGTCVPLFCNPGIPLNPPIVTVGAGMADASGSIDFRVRIPRGTSAALIHSVAFQTRTGPTGIFSTTTAPVASPVLDP
jgi:hypothetical protein